MSEEEWQVLIARKDMEHAGSLPRKDNRRGGVQNLTRSACRSKEMTQMSKAPITAVPSVALSSTAFCSRSQWSNGAAIGNTDEPTE